MSGRQHFDSMVAWLTARYGPEIGPFLARRFAKHLRRNNECADNFRVCDVAVPAEVEQYETLKDRGCCGYVDDEVTHFKSKRTFRFGYNFGH